MGAVSQGCHGLGLSPTLLLRANHCLEALVEAVLRQAVVGDARE